jgi:hypothetical protein
MIYSSFLVALIIFAVVEKQYKTYVFVYGIGVLTLWIGKCILLSRINLKIKRIK